MLTLKVSSASQVSVARTRSRRAVVVVRAMATPADLSKKVQDAVKSAEETCAKPNATQDCAVAWDEVEELSAAVAHKKVADVVSGASDPLEAFCKDAPDADECRVYED